MCCLLIFVIIIIAIIVGIVAWQVGIFPNFKSIFFCCFPLLFSSLLFAQLFALPTVIKLLIPACMHGRSQSKNGAETTRVTARGDCRRSGHQKVTVLRAASALSGRRAVQHVTRLQHAPCGELHTGWRGSARRRSR